MPIDGIEGSDDIEGMEVIDGMEGTIGIAGTAGIDGADGTEGADGIEAIEGNGDIEGICGVLGIEGTDGIAELDAAADPIEGMEAGEVGIDPSGRAFNKRDAICAIRSGVTSFIFDSFLGSTLLLHLRLAIFVVVVITNFDILQDT